MFGPQDVNDYISAVRQTGRRSPLVRVSLLPRSLAQATQLQFLAYSIIPVTAHGDLAADGATAAYVAMPHVFARTKAGCGQWDTANAKAARLTSKGFADAGDPASTAEGILGRIIAVYGLPGAGSGKPDAEVFPARPTLPARKPARRAPETRGTASPARPERKGPILDDTRPPLSGETPGQAFELLRTRVAGAFAQSDIRRRQLELGESWNYSICGLPLQVGKRLLLGLKWGADRSVRHSAQSAMPGKESYREVKGYPFIARSLRYLDKYVGRIEGLNYLNVLPFRAPDVSFLTARDWDLGINAFFLDVIDYLNPPLTVILGTTAVSELGPHVPLDYRTVSVSGGSKSVNAHLGLIQGRVARHPFIALPHPNTPLTAAARPAIWAEAFHNWKPSRFESANPDN